MISPYVLPLVSVKRTECVGIAVATVCKHRRVPIDRVYSIHRNRDYAEARHIVFYLVRKHSKPRLSYKEIGKKFNRNHATIIHGEKLVSNLLETDSKFKKDYKIIEEEFISRMTESMYYFTHADENSDIETVGSYYKKHLANKSAFELIRNKIKDKNKASNER